MSTPAGEIARTILDGFDEHYRLFRESSRGAKERFEQARWSAVLEASRDRIDFHDQGVRATVDEVLRLHPAVKADEALWPQVKLAYIGLLYNHRQPECAETFYNSVACRVLDRAYYHNEYIFWRPAVSTEHLDGREPTWRCYYPTRDGLCRTFRQILADLRLAPRWAHPARDLRLVVRVVRERFPAPREIAADLQLQVVSSLFYRNRAAYIIGRAINGNTETPFAVPLRLDARGALRLDALLVEHEHIAALFSLARAYFMIDTEVPAALVGFLRSIMPNKPAAELYTAIGLQKQGKTLFYRDLFVHLAHSNDLFVRAPGTRGMVMLVFTLPSLPYVFKLIRDQFEPPKDTTAEKVKRSYLLVKYHDRVGRMADTLEYSDVALPIDRFDPELLAELDRLAPSRVERDGEKLVINHLYVERRMVPLDVYMRDESEEKLRFAVRGWGDAVRELAAANIFPGDLLPKNFGVTRFGRVVFYDYDEICYLTEVRFRRIPTPRSDEDVLAAEPWFSVAPDDVFPEEFPTFVWKPGRQRELAKQYNADLADPDWWRIQQRRILEGTPAEFFPYPQELRFVNRP